MNNFDQSTITYRHHRPITVPIPILIIAISNTINGNWIHNVNSLSSQSSGKIALSIQYLFMDHIAYHNIADVHTCTVSY